MGWFGGALAYAIAALLGVAAVWMSRGYRWGYWVGLGGQLALIGSTIALVVTMNTLRETEGDRLLRIVFGGIILLVWLGWQLLQYWRRRVRSWFRSAKQLQQASSPDNRFRGRSLVMRQ
jgi:threonine/homoserine/homoserine lactone efflux protein